MFKAGTGGLTFPLFRGGGGGAGPRPRPAGGLGGPLAAGGGGGALIVGCYAGTGSFFFSSSFSLRIADALKVSSFC